MDEKVPPEPMVPIGLLSRNTSDPLFQPRIRMLATSVTGGLFVGEASIVGEGGLFSARCGFVVPGLPGDSSSRANLLGPLACTGMVCVCVVYPGYENSTSCLPGRNLILQWGVTHSCPVDLILTVVPRGMAVISTGTAPGISIQTRVATTANRTAPPATSTRGFVRTLEGTTTTVLSPSASFSASMRRRVCSASFCSSC